MNLDVLKELGFTEREIKVYLALLETGSSTVGPIATLSGLQHTKVYETLSKLLAKGLVRYVVVSKTKHFEASEPKEILHLIEEKRRKFKSILIELEEKQKHSSQKQIAVIHEGFKAVKALFDNIAEDIQRNDFYYVFALKEDYLESTVPGFLHSFHESLAEKKVVDRLIAHKSTRESVKKMYFDNKNMKIKFADRDTPIGVMILRDRVIQVIWGSRPTAIEIFSRQVQEQYKKFFEATWKELK